VHRAINSTTFSPGISRDSAIRRLQEGVIHTDMGIESARRSGNGVDGDRDSGAQAVFPAERLDPGFYLFELGFGKGQLLPPEERGSCRFCGRWRDEKNGPVKLWEIKMEPIGPSDRGS